MYLDKTDRLLLGNKGSEFGEKQDISIVPPHKLLHHPNSGAQPAVHSIMKPRLRPSHLQGTALSPTDHSIH